MKLTVLGCLGGFPYNGEGTTSFLLQSDGFSLLIDAGSASLIQLERYLDPFDLDAVILSHYHHDHIADLGVLQYYRQLLPTQKQHDQLPIYGHQEDQLHFQSLTLERVSQGIAYKPNETLDLGPFAITFLKTVHPVVCYALRIKEKATGKVLVFSGDTGYFHDFAPFAVGADVLLADTYFLNGHENHPAHLTAGEAGQIAKEAQVSELVLTHLPQTIDLNELQKQAQETAGEGIKVTLAKPNRVIEI